MYANEYHIANLDHNAAQKRSCQLVCSPVSILRTPLTPIPNNSQQSQSSRNVPSGFAIIQCTTTVKAVVVWKDRHFQ